MAILVGIISSNVNFCGIRRLDCAQITWEKALIILILQIVQTISQLANNQIFLI